MTQPVGPTAAESDPDVITLLLAQHASVRNLLAEVESATGPARRQVFDQLRRLLAVHETAEEVVLRPMSRQVAGQRVVDARNAEEQEAAEALAELEKLDVADPEFALRFAGFRRAVLAHADREETEEFPALRAHCTPQELQDLGRRLLKAETSAPTHPHAAVVGSPAVQRLLGPFAAMVDKVRDAL